MTRVGVGKEDFPLVVGYTDCHSRLQVCVWLLFLLPPMEVAKMAARCISELPKGIIGGHILLTLSGEL